MVDRDAFKDRKRAQEEDFFKRQEQELIEKMRRKAEAAAERRQMAEATGITDEEIISNLQELGYNRDTVSLLHLVPLVEVAWADDGVSARERELILEVAKSRGMEEGSPAHQQLSEWLTHCPEPEFFERTLRVIRALLESLPPDQREKGARDLVSYSTSIAQASGGFLGLGQKVSPEERAAIERLAKELESMHGDAVKRVAKHE